MSDESQNPQEAGNMANDKIQMAKESAINAANTAKDKADELYNKLPLDMINEKLKGKVDVKSKKFKHILSGVLCLVLVILVFNCCNGNKLNSSQIRKAQRSLKNNYNELGVDIDEPKLNKVKYRGKEKIQGQSVKLYDATTIIKNPLSGKKERVPVIIIVNNNDITCVTEDMLKELESMVKEIDSL